MIDTSKYLQRLNISETIHPSLETLKKLQRQHLLHIPFENLDIHYNRKIVLDTERIADKILNKKRGGFCYELNSLFFELLKSLDFNVKLVSARVFDQEKGFGKEYDHMAIIATLDNEDWLVDVGFGEFTFAPLNISFGKIQEDERGVFLIERYDSHYLLVKHQDRNGDWKEDYIFSTNAQEFNAFDGMCTFHQTSEDSHFTKNKLCSLATEDGRITLTNDKLKIKSADSSTEISVKNQEEFEVYLKKHFGIVL